MKPTTSYIYDVLDLCRLVDLTMPDTTKLEYLFRSLRPTLVEKIYPLRHADMRRLHESSEGF